MISRGQRGWVSGVAEAVGTGYGWERVVGVAVVAVDIAEEEEEEADEEAEHSGSATVAAAVVTTAVVAAAAAVCVG